MPNNFYAKYPRKPITNISSLLKCLNSDLNELNKVISNMDFYYKANTPDNNGRITVRVLPLLKKMQNRIVQLLLKKVIYPSYLHGYIKNRSSMTNGKSHLNSTILFNEDVKNFFTNCTAKKIYKIWRYFFGFSHEVAKIVTTLTTHKNALPQGAPTSPLLSNLVFWQDEPALAEILYAEGITYTRYADDISASSLTPLSNEKKTFAISSIMGMLTKNGFKPKRVKHKIYNSSNRMLVNGQIVNGKNISLGKDAQGKDYMLNIRAEIYNLEKNKCKISPQEFHAQFNSTLGKLNYLLKYKQTKKTADLKTKLMNLIATSN